MRLPEGYDERPHDRWPVMYVHDGQNLFDGSTSFSGIDWGIHRTLARLSAEEGLPDAIVVGVWNTPERIPEYMPERPMREFASEDVRRRFEETYGGFPKSDAYLGMIVHELKPFIDGRYRTRGGREDTWIMGSSMGGLVSLYALCEYPEVFAGAACLSTSWTIAGKLILAYLQKRLPRAGMHRLYFDYGAEAQVARYESLQKTVDRMVVRSGYRRGVDWITGRFPGAPHSESAWRDRVDVPLRFLLSRR